MMDSILPIRKTVTKVNMDTGVKHWVYPDNNQRQKDYYKISKEDKNRKAFLKKLAKGEFTPHKKMLIRHKDILTIEYIEELIRFNCEGLNEEKDIDYITSHFYKIMNRIEHL